MVGPAVLGLAIKISETEGPTGQLCTTPSAITAVKTARSPSSPPLANLSFVAIVLKNDLIPKDPKGEISLDQTFAKGNNPLFPKNNSISLTNARG